MANVAGVTVAGGGPGQGPSPAQETGSRLPGVFLTWPRALLVFAALTLFVGGRGADFMLLAGGLLLWLAVRAVDAALRGVSVGYRLVDHHAFLGTPASVEVTVTNRSRWPIPLLLIHLRLPPGVPGTFRRVLTLSPRRMRRFRFEIAGLRRGVYRIGDTRVIAADWFGLRTESADIRVGARFVVYPALIQLPAMRLQRRLPLGPTREPLSPFRDEQPVGIRAYVRGDPLRAIAWKASAHRGDLQVREVPPVRESLAWLLLDLDAADWDPLHRHELGEQAVAVAASLLWQRRQAREAVGFAAWGAMVEQDVHGAQSVAPGSWLRLPPRADQGHALRVLEALAGLGFAAGGAFPDRVRREAASLPWGARLLVLVPRDTPELWQVTGALAARGHPVTLFVFERRLGPPAGMTGTVLPRAVEVAFGDGVTFR